MRKVFATAPPPALALGGLWLHLRTSKGRLKRAETKEEHEMSDNDNHTTTAPATVPPLQRYDKWLKSLPASSTTGWRWRKQGMIRTTNISGRVYVRAEAIAEFLARAEAGEFAEEHVTPSRPAAA